MKKFFLNLPIRLKLTAAIVSTSFLVLFLFSAAFIAEEIYSFRNSMVGNISVLADLLGTNSQQSLLLKRDLQAEAVLDSLRAQPRIRAAYLFDSSGKPHAQYLNRSDVAFINNILQLDFNSESSKNWQSAEGPLVTFRWSSLSLFSPVKYQGEKIGTIYLLSDNQLLHARIHGLLLGMLVAIGVMAPLSLLLARYLTGPIAKPLLGLSEKMNLISSQNDFSVRAEKSSNDEVGDLVDGFNDMLTQIEIRDAKISDHQKYLEDTVSNRTRELRDTVSKLEQAKQVADDANQAKSQFLANITHELRTPLIGVLGMNELLARTALDEQQQSLVETVQRSGDDLLSMINDILDFSKIEAGHMRLEPVNMEICKLVEETTYLLAEKAFAKGLRIACHVDQTALWKVTADPVRIRQILLNLLGNAIKFTARGEVFVSLRMTEQSQGLGHFILEVKDTGIGMNEKAQSQVFSAFVQADSTTTRQHGGTGLGLTIVQQMVELMGGRLSLESREGEGSQFRIEMYLPLLGRDEPLLPDSLHGKRLLLYDDVAADQSQMREIFSACGLQVVEASTPEDVWYSLLSEQRQDHHFSLVVLPVSAKLPDDRNLYEVICKEPLLSGLRVVVTSPSAKSPETHLPGEIQFLQKPVLWSSLSRVLARSWQKISLVHAPVVDSPTVEKEPIGTSSMTGQEKHYRILLADDNRVTRELVVLSLRNHPILIEQACSGTEALQALHSADYDLILMDCNMPELDGMETTRRLRERGIEIPVIALTAHIDQRIHDACRTSGMNDMIRKPFRQNDLHSTVEKWLGIAGCDDSPEKEKRNPGAGD